jgi:hypothetical protein
MPALYIIQSATSRIIYSRGPQTIKQFVDLVPVRLRLGLGRRVADLWRRVSPSSGRDANRRGANSVVIWNFRYGQDLQPDSTTVGFTPVAISANVEHGSRRVWNAARSQTQWRGLKAGLPPERGWPLLPFFQAGCCGGLSSGEIESVSTSISVNKSLATARKSRKVGALDLSSNASSSGVASETSAGLSSLAIILFFAS